MGHNINVNQSITRIQGELYFRRYRQQYQMRQERLTDAQLQQVSRPIKVLTYTNLIHYGLPFGNKHSPHTFRQAYLLLSANGPTNCCGTATTEQQMYSTSSSSSSSHDHMNMPPPPSSSSFSSSSSNSQFSFHGYDGGVRQQNDNDSNYNYSQQLSGLNRGPASAYDQRQGLPPPQQTHPINMQQHQQQHHIQQHMQQQQHWIIGSAAEGCDEDDHTGDEGGDGNSDGPNNGTGHGGHIDSHSHSSNECLEKALTMSLTRGPSHEWEWDV